MLCVTLIKQYNLQKLMPKSFTTKTDDQLRWPEFVNATEVKQLLAKAGRRGSADYSSDMQFLKLHLSTEQYKKIFARYRQFKHRRANDLVTFKVPRATIERLTNYALALGYPLSTNLCIVDILHFLSDPVEMLEAKSTLESIVENRKHSLL